jgi:tripartite-type tricarboxylate transporter receptor subunit TctC
MIVPYAAGSTTDVIGRVFAARMRDSLTPSVIIENFSGADGSTGPSRAPRARELWVRPPFPNDVIAAPPKSAASGQLLPLSEPRELM